MIGCPRCEHRMDQRRQWVEDTPVGVVVVDVDADFPFEERECIGCGWGYTVVDCHQRIEELHEALVERERKRARLNWEAKWAS